jgi:hypothetical protein
MAKLKSVLGYILAVVSVQVMIAAVLSFTVLGLGEPFIEATGLQTSANWTGGEVVQTLEHGAYQTEIHRPVFDALFGERKEGFVQVAWRQADALPAHIDEEIDVDADGRADFRIELETTTKQASLTPYSPHVIDLEGVYRLDETLAIRVTLKNPGQ